jgi:hypothetical protein
MVTLSCIQSHTKVGSLHISRIRVLSSSYELEADFLIFNPKAKYTRASVFSYRRKSIFFLLSILDWCQSKSWFIPPQEVRNLKEERSAPVVTCAQISWHEGSNKNEISETYVYVTLPPGISPIAVGINNNNNNNNNNNKYFRYGTNTISIKTIVTKCEKQTPIWKTRYSWVSFRNCNIYVRFCAAAAK